MSTAHKQSGFSLVTAIFLLVVLAGLGAAMVTFSTAQSQNLAMDAMGSRAYQAAHAGIEWAAYNIASNSSVAAATVMAPGSLAGDLAPFGVTVTDIVASQTDDTSYPPGGTPGPIWTHYITSTATWGTPGTANYVERVINAKI